MALNCPSVWRFPEMAQWVAETPFAGFALFSSCDQEINRTFHRLGTEQSTGSDSRCQIHLGVLF